MQAWGAAGEADGGSFHRGPTWAGRATRNGLISGAAKLAMQDLGGKKKDKKKEQSSS